ncbi:Flp pilus assembly protein TadD contains TPR repeat [Paramagnetospirillum magnetotacticum MS-1]|uniref:Flp pilus assembly protein TadD contains TPR repeat n=1 Tax=Paramagnetospirillum magnetotacticum MS-1 TaxID=272627 RepID=A0A0C2YX76_PARME|nr:tetratricopeptide repeat protein [Paramagnetospirillum magnetotacticum]KIL99713.1 Flp pilus assembly protein TadD contains TPR repeat [Paramagnetospirillum magnetotacticum MS-1]
MIGRFAVFALPLALALGACTLTGGGVENGGLSAGVEPSLRAAAAAAESGRDYQGAAQHLSTLYQNRPTDSGLAIALARNLRYSGQGQAAADLMQSHLARSGREALTLLELGKDYLAADRASLAIKMLEEARILAPDNWDIHSTLGVALDSQGRAAEAQSAYARALEITPDNAAVLNNLGLSQALAGQLDAGLATLSRAADLPAATAQVRQNLALLTALKGDGDGAERMARRDLSAEQARINIETLRALAASAR